MTQSVVLTQPVRVGGSVLAAGTTQTLAREIAADLVARGFATPVGVPAWQSTALLVSAQSNPISGIVQIPALYDAGFTRGIETLSKIGVRVGLIGDSITFTNLSSGVANTLSYYDNGYFGWALAFLGIHANAVYNGGVGGEETNQFSDQLDAAIAAGSEVIFYLGGTNNDDSVDMIRLAFADYQSAYQACRSKGVFFFALTPTPNNSDTAEKALRYRSLASMIMASFANKPDSHAADTQASVYDFSANNWKNNYSYDGVHPGSLGAYYMGKAIYNATVARMPKPKNPILASSNDDVVATDAGANQILANPMLTGTSGAKSTGCSGNVASSWSAVCTGGCTAVFSKTTDADGLGEVQTIVATASAAGTVLFYQAVASGKLKAGKSIVGACEIEIESGPTGMDNIKLEVYHDASQKTNWGNKTGNTTVVFDEGFTITPETRPDAYVLSGTNGSGQYTITLGFKTAGEVTANIRYPSLRNG